MITLDKVTVTNGGGMAKTLGDVERFCRSAATRITVCSITKLERNVEKGTANIPVPPGDVYFFDEATGESGNALGLPNAGMEAFRRLLPQMVAMAHAVGKTLVASVVGESIDEIIELVIACLFCGVDGVEINLACPNVHDKGKQKSLFSEQPVVVEELLHRLVAAGLRGKEISVKIAPTSDRQLLGDLCDAVKAVPIITEMVCTNTIGGVRFVRNNVDMIAFRPPGSSEVKHVGGQAGTPLHKPAVWVAETVRSHLPGQVRVLGIGGIFTGAEAIDFLEIGCAGFGCATAIMKRGERALFDISAEIAESASGEL